MKYTFDPRASLIVIPVFVAGPAGVHNFDFAIDTGATRSSMSGAFLEALGYRRDQLKGRFDVRTGSGGVSTGAITVSRFSAFGIVNSDFPLLWMPIPAASRIKGLLGLDFFRGQILKVDFVHGRVSLDLPRRWWQLWR